MKRFGRGLEFGREVGIPPPNRGGLIEALCSVAYFFPAGGRFPRLIAGASLKRCRFAFACGKTRPDSPA